jgi:hypothetical protein
VVFAGFAVGVVCSLIGTQIMGEYGPLVTLRIAIGSGLAFLTAQLLDVAIFRPAARRALVARAAGLNADRLVSLDTAMFFTIAFSASLSLHRTRAMTCLGGGGAADAGPRADGAALGFAGGGRLDGETFARFSGTCALPHHRGGTYTAHHMILFLTSERFCGNLSLGETIERRCSSV